MALNDENSMVMPVQPMYGGYGNGGGFGMGGDWAWILLLLLLGGNGFGWGMGGFGGMMGAGMMGLGYDFPWILAGQTNTDNNVSSGFRDAQLHDSVTSVRDGIAALATQLCSCCGDMQMSLANGFAGVNQNVSNGFANTNLAMCNGFNGVNNSIFGAQTAISQQMSANEIASLNRSFAEQTANTQGFNSVQAQLAQCCCDNRLATADTKYTIATEACATRQTDTQNTTAIINAITSGIQSLKDDLCADRLDAERRENQNLRTQLNMATLAASQTAQTADIINGTYTRLSQCPVGSTPVYGNQPIFTCPQNQYSPCGCNGGNFQ